MTGPDKYEKLVDQLLAMPQYGERWGRYWLDVVRYAEDNPGKRHESAVSVRLAVSRLGDRSDQPGCALRSVRQAAARRRPDAGHVADDLRALGFIALAPQDHKDGRLSKEVIETLHRRLGRARRHGHARPAGPDRRLRPLPRSQVRSDPADDYAPGGRLRFDGARDRGRSSRSTRRPKPGSCGSTSGCSTCTTWPTCSKATRDRSRSRPRGR